MFGLGFQEIVLLMLIALVIFGPGSFERLFSKLKGGASGFQQSFQAQVSRPEPAVTKPSLPASKDSDSWDD